LIRTCPIVQYGGYRAKLGKRLDSPVRGLDVYKITCFIALSPDLDITPEEFAAAWNEAVETRDIAYVQLSQAKGTQFIDPMLVEQTKKTDGTEILAIDIEK